MGAGLLLSSVPVLGFPRPQGHGKEARGGGRSSQGDEGPELGLPAVLKCTGEPPGPTINSGAQGQWRGVGGRASSGTRSGLEAGVASSCPRLVG